jgi:glycosyltransferase involved in cell wall biosynthesis
MCGFVLSSNILVSAVNLHTGGGIQVAISFLYELSLLQESNELPIDAIVSTEVADGLARLNTNTSYFNSYEVINTYGLKAFFSSLNSRIKNYDVVFTVFGPNYLRVKAKKEIVGFAQLWMLNFNNPISERMSFLSKNILRIKFYIQWLFFLRADHYVVELEHVKKSLVDKKGVDSKKISVVYNTVSSLYKDKTKWQPVRIKKNQEEISFGIVTRDYPHKNINILPLVAEALEAKHNLKVHFYTTLNDVEWATKDAFFKKHVSTVGSLSPDQCPSFYEQIDAVVFPSLLECFSATPLEAMVMSKPLFASDRGFVRDVCGDHAVYFDPLDADDIALNIANYFKADTERAEQLQQARDHALGFSSAKGRAEQYLEIIQQHLKG